MTRPAGSARPLRPRSRQAFTLIEVLVATTLTLMMIGAVVSVFEMVSNSVSDSRSTLEMNDRLRATAMQLQRDLAGVTVTMLPPRNPQNNEGYFEFVENTILARSGNSYLPTNSPISAPNPVVLARNTADSNLSDSTDFTVADHDDILMFTTRSPDRPFIGRYGVVTASIESQIAEVVWFVRGRTLYRRQLLVVPNATLPYSSPQNFYVSYDVSVHLDPSTGRLVPNTLGDLTKREYRFAHNRPTFPFDVRYWSLARLPTCAETSSSAWRACQSMPGNPANVPGRSWEDLWSGPDDFDTDNPNRLTNPYAAVFRDNNARLRQSDDVILTNVIGFDVKVWDPGAPLFLRYIGSRTVAVAPGDPGYPTPSDSGSNLGRASYGAYVDLGYFPNCPMPPTGYPRRQFHVVSYDNNNPIAADNFFPGINNPPRSQLQRIYDTWSTHYESDGIAQIGGKLDWATNGFDDDGRNGIDDAGECETMPPYPFPLRSIQVKIRCFDADSRQVRETTVVQDFLP